MNPRLLLSTLTCAAALAVVPATHARDSDLARNAVIGGVLGAIIGDSNNHHAAEGAFIGAAAGLILTAAADDHCYDNRVYAPAPDCNRRVVVVDRCAPPPRVVYVPAPPRCDSRVTVVRPYYPAPRVVVIDRRNDRCDDRYDRRSDGRYNRGRHDDRRDRRDRDYRDEYAYDGRR